jgi:hypothetical protein
VTTQTTHKKPKTSGEVDAYCTKCKLDLGHRIIAMVGETIKKVECRTCGSHHLYRAPKSEKAAAANAPKRASEPRKAAGERSSSSRADRDPTQVWEQAIAGQPATAFVPYRVTTTLGPGELVRHPKFGDGYVARVIDRSKVEILFKDGPRTMAHGLET